MTGHEHDREHEDVVVLLDEEGNEFEFLVIDVIEVDGAEYAILLPAAEEEEPAAEVLRIEVEDGKEILVQVEDDEEWERVAEAWSELNDGEDEE